MKPVCELEVDGGIDPATAHICADEGANVFVAGSAVFGNRTGVAAAMQDLRFALQPVTQ
ncbi:MAG: rpe [Candidatus Solibacter sp.]|nr:rpe [Candidatus Solibacter sp.]